MGCLCHLLMAEEKRVEVVANFGVSGEHLTAVLEERGSSIVVKEAKLGEYASWIPKEKKSFMRKISTKLGRDVGIKKVQVDPHLHKIIFWNFPDHYLNQIELRKLPKEKLVLFMWEPPSVLRKMYSSEVLDLFGKVYTWDDSLVDNQKFFKFYYPDIKEMGALPVSFSKKKLCTLVNANKSSGFVYDVDMERERFIAFLEKEHPTDFEFYGGGWDRSLHPSWKGLPGNKVKTLRHYKFTIAYGNITDSKGLISEKVMEIFAAGSIPIYWGSSNVTDYLPKGCFIDRRDFKSLEDLYGYLKSLTQTDYEGYLEEALVFFKNHPQFKQGTFRVEPFSKKKFCTLIHAKNQTDPCHELYSERVKVINFFEREHPEDFDFYGFGWNAALHPRYLGAIEDKIGTLQNYKFVIAYENITDIHGYISEKIFDVFAAGCVPVYWGATNIADFIPKGCFIDRRDFGTMEEVYQYMKKMTEAEYQGYLERICAFLRSDQAKVFSREQWEQTFYEATL